MTDAERKVQERRENQRRYHAFLDERIPALQNEGKPHPPPMPSRLTLGERVQRTRPNMEGSHFPGAKAREQADREWAEAA